MSTIQSIQGIAPKRHTQLAAAFVTLGTLVALTAAALVLFAFTSKGTTGSTRPATSAQRPSQPLIQYRGTGQPPTSIHLSSGAPPTVGLLRAEHSYGDVP